MSMGEDRGAKTEKWTERKAVRVVLWKLAEEVTQGDKRSGRGRLDGGKKEIRRVKGWQRGRTRIRGRADGGWTR